MAQAYQPMQQPLPDWGNISDMIFRAGQEAKDRDQKRAEFLLRQEASNRDQARLDEQMRRQGAIEERQRGNDVAEALPRLKSMLTPGSADYDPQTAMSLARAKGIDLKEVAPPSPGATPVAPQAPVRAPTEYGPRETPEIAQQAGLMRALRGAPGDQNPAMGAAEDQRQMGLAEAERKRFAGANETDQEFAGRQGDFTHAQAQYQGQNAAFQQASKRLPTYSGQSLIGDINIDPNAAVASREEMLRRQREQLAPLGQIPGAEKMQPVIQAMIAAGMPGSEVAKFVSEATKENQADASKAQYSLTAADQNRHNRAMEAAAAAAARDRERTASSNQQNKDDTTTNRNLTTYLGTVKEFENNAGIKADVGMMKNIGKIHEELTNSPTSPIAQAAAIDTIAQIAQGGKASQGVMNQINAHALGPIETAYDHTYQLTHNGAHSPAWVKSMSDTLGGLKRYAGSEQERVMQGFEAAAGDTSPFSGPEYSGLRDSQRRKIAASLGMDIPAPRKEEAGAMRPGTGKRASRTDKPNPIMDARQPTPTVSDFEREHGF